MKVYNVDHIRNVALIGHQGSGKTTLAEAMLFADGTLKRMGTIEDGNTTSDYHPSEVERQMSVFSSLIHVKTGDCKINLIDVPGYPDFIGEVITALSVVDSAVFVINAVEGVQLGTEMGWNYAQEFNKPAMFVLNQLDKTETDFRTLVSDIQERFGRGATIIQIPAGSGSRAIIDVLLMKQITYNEGQARPAVTDIAPEFLEEAEQLHNELIENIAENDETLMELYFEKGTLSEEEMRKGLHEAMMKRQLFPLFLTSARESIGVTRLMDFIGNVAPSPAECEGMRDQEGDLITTDPDASTTVFVYRTMAEQHVGEYSFFRVVQGTLSQGQDLENASNTGSERLGQLFVLNGRDREQVEKMVAGDLGAVVKLKNTHTNDTLRVKGTSIKMAPITYPAPRYTTAIRPQKQGEEDKLAQGLHQLANEDPSLVLAQDPHLNQMLLGGQGQMHLTIAQYRLSHRFGVDIEFYRPKISYRETIQSASRASYRHKKQSGGAGQFADISMLVEPLHGEFNPPADIKVRNVTELETPWGAKIEFIDAIVGGVIDMRRFAGSIQKGILEAMQQGPIAGYPVGAVRVVVFDGGEHPVDSNDAAFKSAGRMCFREGFRNANPVILEPIHEVEILVPESYTGEVMGDLNPRRGQIQGIEAEGTLQKIKATIPESELYQYSTALRSMTQGRGMHQSSFLRYDPMPRDVQNEVVKAAEDNMVEA